MFGKFLKAVGQIFIWLIILFLIGGLAMFGISDIFRAPGKNIVATVGNVDISKSQIDNIVNREKQQLAGRNLPETMVEQFMQYITQNAIDQEINRTLLQLKAQAMSIEVDKMQILKKEFIEAANMDKQQLKSFFRANGGEDYFLNKMEEEKKLTFVESIFSSIPLIDKNSIEALHKFEKQKRDITVLQLKADSLKGINDPSEDEVKSYYDNNKNKYLSDEYRGVTYLLLDSKMIEDEEILKDENMVADVLYEASGNLLDLLAGGLTLEESAEKLGIKTEVINSLNIKGADKNIGELEITKIVPEFTETVFNLEEGEVSDIMESPSGNYYAVARIDSITPQKVKPLLEIEPIIVSEIKRSKKLEELLVTSENIQKALEEGESVKSLVDKYGVEFKKFEGVDRGSMDIPADLVDEIFNIKIGKASNVVKDSNGNLLIAVVDKIIEADDIDPYEMLETKDLIEKEVFQEALFQYLQYLKTQYKVKIKG